MLFICYPKCSTCKKAKKFLTDHQIEFDERHIVEEKLNKEDNISIIMISHDIEDSVKYASHVLYTGNKVFYGTKKEYEDRQYDR